MTSVPAAAEWDVWGLRARVVVREAKVLDEARALCEGVLAGIGAVADRFDPASELSRLAEDGRTQPLSPLLADLVAEGLSAAAASGGAVDPTVGSALIDLGYDRDFHLVRHGDRIIAEVRRVRGWRSVSLVHDLLTLPPGVVLDLGATAKASAADRCARAVAARFRTGALVALGGDIATAGPGPDWQIDIQDLAEAIPARVSLPAGWAVSTSSTRRRTWTADGRLQHHLIDPRTSRPVVGTWAAVTAVARTCLAANTATTGAMVKGRAEADWLTRIGVPARALGTEGDVVFFGGWPLPQAAA